VDAIAGNSINTYFFGSPSSAAATFASDTPALVGAAVAQLPLLEEEQPISYH
jgi:hypothetical protein